MGSQQISRKVAGSDNRPVAVIVPLLMLFAITASAQTFTVLHNFGGSDGRYPTSTLVFDRAGNLYGTTEYGGTGNSGGDGVVFQLKPGNSGRWVFNPIHLFTGNRGTGDGANPLDYGGLVFDSAGNLYGSTTILGPNNGGTVFELSPQGGLWVFGTIHAFSEGQGPDSALTLDAVGDLYGTTVGGGQFGNGQVFKLSHSGNGWTFTDLHDFFVNNDEGINPVGGITLDSSGNLCGTAGRSGANGAGSVWEITP